MISTNLDNNLDFIQVLETGKVITLWLEWFLETTNETTKAMGQNSAQQGLELRMEPQAADWGWFHSDSQNKFAP